MGGNLYGFAPSEATGHAFASVSLLSDLFFNILHAYFQRLTGIYYPMTTVVFGPKLAEKRWEMGHIFDGQSGKF